MGLFDWFTGTVRPDDGIAPRSPQEVHQALGSLNRPDERGQVNRVERMWTIGRGDDGGVELRDGASFSSDDLKAPLRRTVTRLGWAWRGDVFGKL